MKDAGPTLPSLCPYATKLHVVIQRVKISYKSEMKVLAYVGQKEGLESRLTEGRGESGDPEHHPGNKTIHRTKQVSRKLEAAVSAMQPASGPAWSQVCGTPAQLWHRVHQGPLPASGEEASRHLARPALGGPWNGSSTSFC